MKNQITPNLWRLALALIFFSFILVSCSKNAKQIVIEIPLSKTSLDSVRYYACGNYQLIYTTGGWSGEVFFYKDNYMSIFPNDSISWTYRSAINTRCRISYRRIRTGSVGDSTNMIEYTDRNSTAFGGLLVIKKRNDTLILRDETTDAFTYYFAAR